MTATGCCGAAVGMLESRGIVAARARHGYQLIDCFRDTAQLGRVWDLSTSQLYAVLKRLEAQVQTMPNIAERLPKIRERFRKIAAARAKTAQAGASIN